MDTRLVEMLSYTIAYFNFFITSVLLFMVRNNYNRLGGKLFLIVMCTLAIKDKYYCNRTYGSNGLMAVAHMQTNYTLDKNDRKLLSLKCRIQNA